MPLSCRKDSQTFLTYEKKKQKFRKDKAIPENRHFSAVERRTILNVSTIVIWVDSLSWNLVSIPFLRNWMEMNPLEELNYGWETIEKEYSIFCLFFKTYLRLIHQRCSPVRVAKTYQKEVK